jgi:hypothetical protein
MFIKIVRKRSQFFDIGGNQQKNLRRISLIPPEYGTLKIGEGFSQHRI